MKRLGVGMVRACKVRKSMKSLIPASTLTFFQESGGTSLCLMFN
jgi:hypothetical protein